MTKLIEDLAAELIRQAYAEGYRNGKHDEEVRSDVNPFKLGECSMETPQAKRDRIVEQAKSDFHGWNISTVEYVVNKRKRTIACLIYGPDTGKVVRKGIAKCAPGDCFNVWIGKAIALRRALGLDVPAEYLSVPNPSEVRVGDKIKWTKNYVIIGINDGTYRFRGERDGWVSSYLDYDRETLVSKIIDDSREEESE